MILIASGIDTFSKINYGDARKVLQNSGVPVYIIGTGKCSRRSTAINCRRPIALGMPGRMTWLQADNTLQTFREGNWRRLFSGDV